MHCRIEIQNGDNCTDLTERWTRKYVSDDFFILMNMQIEYKDLQPPVLGLRISRWSFYTEV